LIINQLTIDFSLSTKLLKRGYGIARRTILGFAALP